MTHLSDCPVLVAESNRIGYLTLNRPASLNTLTLPMVCALQRQLEAWAADPTILAVVLRGAGGKAFCAGGDIRALYDSFLAEDGRYLSFFEKEYALDHYLHCYPKPVLALMDGFVLGGGMGLVQGSLLRVISERTRVGMPEVGIGYFPDVGSSYFLSRLPDALGLYLGVTGVHLSPADALYAGLADWYLPSEGFAELERSLDTLSWDVHPRQAIGNLLASFGKRHLAGGELKNLHPAIETHFSLPDIPTIRASLLAEHRPEYRAWAEETVRLLDSRSPLSLCVTLELLQRGRHLSLNDCFALELHLDRQWFAQGDIMEGVRALLVDKDKSPRWSPPTLGEVRPEQVQAFFADFRPGEERVGWGM
ncbi:Enoyl-CoA hydratase/isomerase [Azotobacter beijerinckii]|uniref:3-hydroxyisobutyryl-CoA hydrolase n=1 Tax=Azotobacter beijerinckii TaxID=170623 RepID=A0A1H8ZX50_9GAMM|nr:enoyl-CoA hydratase/isomerase family protein [Azotobacter beijerinckii]SEI46071.1 Enoyl-CoA hydratase/isomerase [Azotobacter beijerinckii]SEI46273.1 Enoyl-CoA hydratase/isomerase [Azotobacter beijerinckii]SEP69009.1 Enoyl-CoA hydratase/isomerase [Azotobacter beijerinckii]